MPNEFKDTTVLLDLDSVMKCIQNIFELDKSGDYLYIGGSSVKFMVNNVLVHLNSSDFENNIFIALPTLTSKDFTNSSFLYQLNNIATKIRITMKARHNIILTSKHLIYVSDYANGKVPENEHVMGIMLSDPEEIRKARKYCDEIWSAGFPLHFG